MDRRWKVGQLLYINDAVHIKEMRYYLNHTIEKFGKRGSSYHCERPVGGLYQREKVMSPRELGIRLKLRNKMWVFVSTYVRSGKMRRRDIDFGLI